MNTNKKEGLIRIGIFYDGNYFFQVSNYYLYGHDKKARIDISGLHRYIKTKVGKEEGTARQRCQIVDAHYFRGRVNAKEARDASGGNQLYHERVFDEILMKEGVTTHYAPLYISSDGKRKERGIDVWLALEAFEMSQYKRFDVLVLVACDGDYVPLVRKLNTLGTRVMLLSWDFSYKDTYGLKETRTSQALIDVATYPISMDKEIDDRTNKDPEIKDLFLSKNDSDDYSLTVDGFSQSLPISLSEDTFDGRIFSLKEGYGFIDRSAQNKDNLFFYYGAVRDVEFKDLVPGQQVRYRIGKNEKGDDIALDVSPLSN